MHFLEMPGMLCNFMISKVLRKARCCQDCIVIHVLKVKELQEGQFCRLQTSVAVIIKMHATSKALLMVR